MKLKRASPRQNSNRLSWIAFLITPSGRVWVGNFKSELGKGSLQNCKLQAPWGVGWACGETSRGRCGQQDSDGAAGVSRLQVEHRVKGHPEWLASKKTTQLDFPFSAPVKNLTILQN